MSRRGATTAAHNRNIILIDELHQRLCKRFRFERVDGLPVHVERQAGIRDAGDRQSGLFPRIRMGSRMCSGPVEQFRPITSMGMPSRMARRRSYRCEQHTPGGIQRDLRLDWQAVPVSSKAFWMPVMAALTSRISWKSRSKAGQPRPG